MPVDQIDMVELANNAERLFSYRNEQAWSPVVTVHDRWAVLYIAAAEGIDGVHESVIDAAHWANDLIARAAGR